MDLEKVRIFFVISNKYEDEKETSEYMQEAYSVCASNHTNITWIREQDTHEYEFLKTDFIVFEEFSGEFFDEVCKTKCARIVGPICLLACLTEGKRIPNVDWPLLNISLEDCVVSCSSLNKQQKQDIGNKIQSMGGYYTASLPEASTHLVTDSVRSQKYTKAASTGIKVVLPSWIESIWDASQKEIVRWDDERFSIHNCKPFHNLTICSTGLDNSDREKIRKLVEINGGKFSNALVLKHTDVLICASASGQKYVAAKKQKIDCVDINWILDSAKKGYAVCVADYAIKKGTSTPVKENNVDPNFSMISAIGGPAFNTQSILQESISNTFPFPVKPTKRVPGFAKLVESLDIKQAKQAGSFLDGCSIYLIGFSSEHQEKLCKILNFSGSTRYDSFSERISHVVVGDPSCHEMKILAGKDLHCALVSVEWVLHSMENGKPISEEKYLISPWLSPSASKSPLVKKGLRLLKADISILGNETIKPTTPEPPSVGIDDEIRKQYLNPFGTGTEDTLAAALAQNNFDTYQHAEHKESIKSASKIQKGTSNADHKNRSIKNASTIHNETSIAEQIFEHLKFLVVNFEPHEEEELVKGIKSFGGVVVPKNFKGVPDFAIVPKHLTKLRQTATEIVTELWLSECFNSKRVVEPIEYYHRPCIVKSNTTLKGTVISISGFDHPEKHFLKVMCESMGSILQDSMARTAKVERNLHPSTHLISLKPSGQKYEAAVKWGLFIVSKDWVLKCASSNTKVEESDYLVGNSRPVFKEMDVSGFSFKDKSGGGKENLNEPNLSASSAASKSNRSFTLNVSINKSTISQKVRDEEEALENICKIAENIYTNTPTTSRTPIITTPVCTPKNQPEMDSPIASQITPVDKLLSKANFNLKFDNRKTPSPKRPREDDIDTPDSPYGAFICDPPPKELRKKFARWINGFPDYQQREKCLSTPLTELKKRLLKKFCSDQRQANARVPKQPDFDSVEMEEEKASIEENTDFNIPAEDTPENKLINEKLQEMQSLVTSSGGRRRSSIRPHNPVPDSHYTPIESQPFSVVWDENIEVTTSSAVSEPQKLFMISGIVDERADLVEKIESLGGTVSDLQQFDPESTHLLVEKLSRNEKVLCSMASGKWILHVSYVTDSFSAGKFLNCEEYEFGSPKSMNKFHVDKESSERAKMAHHWRKKNAERGYGPFHNIKALLICNKKVQLKRVIEAGGGMVVDAKPPYDENIFATHCFVERAAVFNNKELIPLAKKGIYCVNTLYLSEFLHGKDDIHDHILAHLSKYYD